MLNYEFRWNNLIVETRSGTRHGCATISGGMWPTDTLSVSSQNNETGLKGKLLKWVSDLIIKSKHLNRDSVAFPFCVEEILLLKFMRWILKVSSVHIIQE
jgi:hypothetical protein